MTFCSFDRMVARCSFLLLNSENLSIGLNISVVDPIFIFICIVNWLIADILVLSQVVWVLYAPVSCLGRMQSFWELVLGWALVLSTPLYVVLAVC